MKHPALPLTPAPKASGALLPSLALMLCCVGMVVKLPSPLLMQMMDKYQASFQSMVWLMSSYPLAFTLGAPLLGWFTDRMQRRQLLLPAMVLFTVSVFAITLAPSLVIAIALRVVAGVCAAIIVPSAFAVVVDEVVPARQTGALGKVMFGMALGTATGPELAGLLAGMDDWHVPVVVVAGACLVAMLSVARSLPDRELMPGQTGSSLGNGLLMRPLLAKGAWHGIGLVAPTLVGLVMLKGEQFSRAQIGSSVFACAAGLAVGNLVAGVVRGLLSRDEDLVLLAVLLLALCMGTFMLVPLTLSVALALFAGWGLALGLGAAAVSAVLANRAGPDKGMLLGFAEMLNGAAMLLGLPLATWLLETSGPDAALAVLAAGVGLGTWLVVLDWAATRRPAQGLAPLQGP